MTDCPIHPNLFTWPANNPVLLGGKCPHCGEVSFPAQLSCRNCGQNDSKLVELGDRGSLWPWTIQSFLPKSPYVSDETAETFKPFGVGYIEMPAGIRIESRLRISNPTKLRIGMPMKLVIEKFSSNDKGGSNLCFAFDRLEDS